MEENNMPKNPMQDKSFIFGLAAGLAAISTIALIALLIYIFTGGRSACLAQTNGGSASSTAKVAKNFETCLASTKYDSLIQANQSEGSQLGVQGTPATFVNGYLVSGALPYEAFKQLIDELLAGKTPNDTFLQDQTTKKIVKVDMPQIIESDHVTGAKNGKITLVEFSDFQCPYCGKNKTTMDQILKAYPNDVTLVFKHFPLSFHPFAKPAVVASECANEQGKFWEMYDKLFALNNSNTLSLETIKSAATEIGLK
ncbi:MAG: thioredoxin domain-containing protein [Candidatus Parcubacteria bacterium]|nr:thioredoxin domain-containing protein [Candidatus Parcubacteria bacterium]